jgi:asparagine N-glycosylation enzyme membrane subunit Stt3
LHRAVAVAAIAGIVVYPNVPLALTVAAGPNGGPTAAWLGALDRIRTHTPEPFGSPEAYYARYRSADEAPTAAYSVMVWWDYAWWVTAIARRPPATNPTQVAVKEAARFFLSTDEDEALAYLRQRKSRYVIVDRSIPMSTATAGRPMASQIEVMARWAEREPSQYYELFFDRGQPVFIYSVEYYATMAIRLFAYGGKAYTPSNSTFAINYSGRNITESMSFATYEEGAAFVANDPKRWRLAGRHPLLSPVPVSALKHFGREHTSLQGVDGPIGRIPEVAVFQVDP